MKTVTQKIVFTKEQVEEVNKFRVDLENKNIKFDFEGSLLEGTAFLRGLSEIVDTANH